MRSLPLLLAALTLPALAQSPALRDATLFQTDQPWSPRVNVEAGTVMAYGLSNDLPGRIRSWQSHGYRVAVMTGVAWGEYGDYLRGDFDGKEHWNETQQEKSGKLILHSGREVPYISPTPSYGRYLSRGVLRALDAGAQAIYLEEPEFWARAGWSDSFKQSWASFYHEPWQDPSSSPDAQYRASKLKYVLYQRALAEVFAAVRTWGQQHGKQIPCYVATHSLINYAQWQIVSPESSLLDVGADGYIAQVWTGTSRAPNVYGGIRAERTFETAFLEYGALQNIARSSAKRIWYLNDPIEDNPNHSWPDYRENWQSTLVASLLQPEVSSFEILPWPDRIFGAKGGLRPSAEPTDSNPHPPRSYIPASYQTELQTVFHALGQLPGQPARWQVAGTEGIGVLVSDTLMFQRTTPDPSDPDLSNVYGLALPLLQHGIPVEPVQIESTYRNNSRRGPLPGLNDPSKFLSHYKVLLLTYEGQKPPSPAFHQALAAWVRNGGALLVIDNDEDPYNHAHDWWNTPETPHTNVRHLDRSGTAVSSRAAERPLYFASTPTTNSASATAVATAAEKPASPPTPTTSSTSAGTTQTIPRTLLFQALGLDPNSTGLHHVGKGVVLFESQSPSALAWNPSGSDQVLALARRAAAAVVLPWRERSSLVLRRGPFLIASGLDLPAGTPLPSDATRVQNSGVQPLPPATALSSRPEASRSEAGVEGPASPQPPRTSSIATPIPGSFIDLFDPHLTLRSNPTLHPGERLFLLDPSAFPATTPRVLAGSARITAETHTRSTLSFTLSSIDARSPGNGFPSSPNAPNPNAPNPGTTGRATPNSPGSPTEPGSPQGTNTSTTPGSPTEPDLTVLRLLLPRPLRSATLDGQPLPTPDNSASPTMPLLTLPASSTPRHLSVTF